MTRPAIGSYEEARMFARKAFRRLSTAQKLQWLSDMTAFIDEANPDIRRRRLGLEKARLRRR